MFGGDGSAPVGNGFGDFKGTIFGDRERDEQAKKFFGPGLVQAEFGGFRNEFDAHDGVGEGEVHDRVAEAVVIGTPGHVKDRPFDGAAGNEVGLRVVDVGGGALGFAPHVAGDGEADGGERGGEPEDGEEG